MLLTDLGLDLAGAYGLALDVAPGGVVIADRHGTILLVNCEIERRFGHPRTELVGRSVDVLIPGGAAMVHDAVDGATPVARAPASPRRAVARRKDSSEVAIDVAFNPVQTAAGVFVVLPVVETTDPARMVETQRTALAEQPAIDRLIAELSSQFINLPADRIDQAIRDGLRQASELLRLDRGTFVRIGPNGTLLPPVDWTTANVAPLDPATAVRERFPWTMERVLAGEVVCFSSRDEIPSAVDRASYEALGTLSAVAVPLAVEGRVTAIVGFSAVQTPRPWPPELVHCLAMIAAVFGGAAARQRRDEALEAAVDEARRLKDQLQMENVYLRQEARDRLGPSEIVGQSAALRRVLAQIQQVAATDSTVLLLGETGTGKELLAAHIHALGPRRARSMVRVNCAAVPATLVESELFGREKGAFTGALSRQIGRFELADHSTIFLDEIGDLPLEVQVKLLRVLEERKFERLGSPRPISVDTRIIAATHRNLEQRIAEGAFREDLYYRLNVFPIEVPPLRDRIEDIPLLVYRLVEEFSRALGKRIDLIEPDTLAAMQRYPWPGNVRELRNVVERAMIVASSRRLTIALPETPSAPPRHSPKLVDVEREHIRTVLEASAWRIRGAGGAANRLGMKPTTLETRMAKLGLKRPSS